LSFVEWNISSSLYSLEFYSSEHARIQVIALCTQDKFCGDLAITHRRMLDSAIPNERGRAAESHGGSEGAGSSGDGAAPLSRGSASNSTAAVDGSRDTDPQPYLAHGYTQVSWLGNSSRLGRVQLSLKFGKQQCVLKLENNAAAAALQHEVMSAVYSEKKLHVVNMNSFYPPDAYDSRCCFELEYLGSDLPSYILQHGIMPAYNRKIFARHLLEGVDYIHSVKTAKFANGICHMDIKPWNLLFDSSFRMRLIDFDSSRGAGADARVPEPTGVTVSYTSPEAFNAYDTGFREPFVADKAHDMFCVGLVLWVLFDS
jgi:serine/threonine protein kinase